MFKWSLGAKITTGFMVILLVQLALSYMSWLSVNEFENTAKWTSHTNRIIGLLESLHKNLLNVQSAQRGFIISGNETFVEPQRGAQKAAEDDLALLAAETHDNMEQQKRLETLQPLVLNKFREVNEVIQLRRQMGAEAAIKKGSEETGLASMANIRDLINRMVDDETKLLASRQKDFLDSAWTSRWIVGVGVAVSVTLVILIGSWLWTDIVWPMAEVTAASGRIAEGDLTVRLAPTNRVDEVGDLMRGFSRMQDSLNSMALAAQAIARGDLVSEVKPQSALDTLGNSFATMRTSLRRSTSELQDAANVLGTSASQILAATTQGATGASETATAVSETTVTIEEVKQTAQLASQKARLVSDNAQKASEIAQTGRTAMDASFDSMGKIQLQMGSIAETVVRLSEQSQTIGEIVATVADLAEQSNLLAVNAAIEAARAGDQGKGFAVVAQEVKSLADQSKQATVQVRVILSDIQKAISRSVMAAEQGDKTVEAGMRQATAANDSIRSLAEVIEAGAQAALQIAASSQQQSVGMDQIASAMENIKEAINQNVSGTRQTEAAARNLHGVGQKLQKLINQYQVKAA
ncbi:MAG: methyl-accepting chemotaxis protein [Candidatus Methylacidiphilales bacterium]|nr:methyl-accepting chemotaxis protein [Candidatus Methylacidiphilales bacterium]